MGLMLAIEMNSADLAKQVVAKMLERHILINRTRETVLRFLPPYIMSHEDVDVAIAAMNDILSEQNAGVPTLAATHPITRGSQNG